MVRRPRVGALLVVCLSFCGAARAEDFTGFYAGVNAGIAFDRTRTGRAAPTPSSTGAGDREPPAGLPPSAEAAARTMQGARANRAGR